MIRKLLITISMILGLISPISLLAVTKSFQVDTGGTLTNGLLSYYQLEDVSDYWSVNTLTNVNAISFASSGIVSFAANGGTANSNKYLKVDSDLGTAGASTSISCWLRINTDLGSGGQYNPIAIFDLGTVTQQTIFLYNNSGTKQVWFLRQRSGVANDANIYNWDWSVDTWYHLVYTYDGTNVYGYINGTGVGTSTPASGNGTNNNNADRFSILAYDTGQAIGNYFSGLVDEAGVWNRALTQTEVTDLYNSGAGQTMITTGETIIKFLMKIFWWW